jgi:hypothetical protein
MQIIIVQILIFHASFFIKFMGAAVAQSAL